MSAETATNLAITGIGATNGGEVRSAKIEGIGRINGDLVCSHDFTVNGKADVKGGVQAASADINGVASLEGSLRVGRCRVEGKLKIDGHFNAEEIGIHGSVTVHGNCEAEKLSGSGKLQMESLNADEIKIILQGSSGIREIGGERIEVLEHKTSHNSSKWLKLLPVSIENKLTAQTIEGDDIYLENTTAGIVRGSSVRIGSGCDIGLVEYKEHFELDAGSTVREHIQL